jgi:hypothetical protein
MVEPRDPNFPVPQRSVSLNSDAWILNKTRRCDVQAFVFEYSSFRFFTILPCEKSLSDVWVSHVIKMFVVSWRCSWFLSDAHAVRNWFRNKRGGTFNKCFLKCTNDTEQTVARNELDKTTLPIRRSVLLDIFFLRKQRYRCRTLVSDCVSRCFVASQKAYPRTLSDSAWKCIRLYC